MSWVFVPCLIVGAWLVSANAATESTSKVYNQFVSQQIASRLKAGVLYRDLYGTLQVEGPKDQEVLKSIMQNYGDRKLPVPRHDGARLIFPDQKPALEIEIVDYLMGRIRVNNVDVDFGIRRSFADKIAYLERVLSRPQSQGFLQWRLPASILLRAESAQAAGELAAMVLAFDSRTMVWDWNAAKNTRAVRDAQANEVKVGEIIRALQGRFSTKAAYRNLRVELGSCDVSRGSVWDGNELLFSWDRYEKNSLAEKMRECCKIKKQCEAGIHRVFPASSEKPMRVDEFNATK